MNALRNLRVWAACAIALLWMCAATATQPDPPARVGRLNHAEGPVAFSAAGEDEWVEAHPNRPLAAGDRFWTDSHSRAELQIGASAVRIDGRTRVEVLAVDDRATQLGVVQGSVSVHIRTLAEGENFEVDTPQLAWRAAYPGEYRIDVDSEHGTTRVTVHAGTGSAYGDRGQALPLAAGQQITFQGRALTRLAAHESPPLDNFDRWSTERQRREEHSIAARYLPRTLTGYQQLDAHGLWSQDTRYGPVWFPQGVEADWAPYRNGRWEWIAPWGWTWIDDAPWAFGTSHYGRWTLIGERWAWVPGRLGAQPAYAPALVAFVGSTTSAWPQAIGGPPTIGWFPLAPGEAWRPPYPASADYVDAVNPHAAFIAPGGTYAHQRRSQALTLIAVDAFHRGRPVPGGWRAVASHWLTQAQVVPPPPALVQVASARRSATAPASAEAPPASAPSPAGNETPVAAERARDRPRVRSAGARQAPRAIVRAEGSKQTRAAPQAVASRRPSVAKRAPEPASAGKHERHRETQALAQQRAHREAWRRHHEALREQWRRDQEAWDARQRRESRDSSASRAGVASREG